MGATFGFDCFRDFGRGDLSCRKYPDWSAGCCDGTEACGELNWKDSSAMYIGDYGRGTETCGTVNCKGCLGMY